MHHYSSFFLFRVTFLIFLNYTFASLTASDAYLRNNAISLTQELTCLSSSPPSASSSSSSSGFGRALYLYPIRFLDPSTNTTASFPCRFSFSIIHSSLCPFADGFAFLITSNADLFSHSDGYMGLPGPALSPQDSFFAVEFDTSFDPSLGDIYGNHIGIDVRTVISFASVDAASRGIDLKSGRQIRAWIEYRDALKLIQVWAGYSRIRPRSPLLVVQIVSKQFKEFLHVGFKEFMHVGFSAANGQGSALHIIERWRFKTFVDMIEGQECLMCYPEDSVSNSSSPYANPSTYRRLVVMIFMLVYCTAGISGGHINPAVTFGLFLGRKVSLIRAVLYMVAQCLGAICGCGLVKAFQSSYYNRYGGGANMLADGYNKGVGLGAEIIGTFVLVYTVFSATDPKRSARDSHVPVLAPLPIGFAVFMVHLATIPITGTGINPARSFGAAVIINREKVWDDQWIFWVGPFIGAAIAAFYHQFVLRAAAIKALGSFRSNA